MVAAAAMIMMTVVMTADAVVRDERDPRAALAAHSRRRVLPLGPRAARRGYAPSQRACSFGDPILRRRAAARCAAAAHSSRAAPPSLFSSLLSLLSCLFSLFSSLISSLFSSLLFSSRLVSSRLVSSLLFSSLLFSSLSSLSLGTYLSDHAAPATVFMSVGAWFGASALLHLVLLFMKPPKAKGGKAN